MGIITHRARKTTQAVIMVITCAMLVGCGVFGNKTPTQQYQQAAIAYVAATDAATVAINADWVSLEEAEAMSTIRKAAHARLAEMRAMLTVNRVEPGSDFDIALARYRQVISVLTELAESPGTEPVTDPEPLPALPPTP